MLYLEGKFAGVAEDHHVAFPSNRGQLVEGGEDKHGGLAHTRFGLGRNKEIKTRGKES